MLVNMRTLHVRPSVPLVKLKAFLAPLRNMIEVASLLGIGPQVEHLALAVFVVDREPPSVAGDNAADGSFRRAERRLNRYGLPAVVGE
ncbi:MAG: hypothetical protein HQ592_13170 [Planctomycetes bacterium]|nr:hypothetical protein [Planctomycetota bacterium]